MTPEELKAIRYWEIQKTDYLISNQREHAYAAVGELLAEIDALRAALEAQRKKFHEEDYQIGLKDGTLLANEALKEEIKVLKATVERLTRRIEIATCY